MLGRVSTAGAANLSLKRNQQRIYSNADAFLSVPTQVTYVGLRNQQSATFPILCLKHMSEKICGIETDCLHLLSVQPAFSY